MTRIRRLSVLLALLPLACGDSSGDEGNFTDSVGSQGTDTQTSTGDQEGGSDDVGSEGTTTTTTTGDGDTTTTTTTGDGDTGTADTTGDGDTGTTDTTTTGDGDTGTTDTTTTGDGDTGTTDTTGDTGTTDTTTTGDGDTGSTDGMMNTETAPPCDEFQVTLDPLPPNVMIVLDKSRSMFTNYWDHDNNGGTPQITRWNSLYQVVDNIVTAFDTKINFGANLFPSVQAQNVYGPAACVTSDFPEVTVGPANGAAILATIPGPMVTNSYGGTPATLGVQTAYDHLMTLDPQIPQAMILVTDGAANCDQTAQTNFELFEVYDDALPALVDDAWSNDGIPTYVVGIDIANMVIDDGIGGDPNGINPTVKLNEVASLGGTGSFFNSQDQAELEAALNDVIDSVKTCTIPLDEEPFFPEFTKVLVSGVEWDMVMDCGSEDGWIYSNPYDTIELCGAACEALKDAGEADVEYYCNPG